MKKVNQDKLRAQTTEDLIKYFISKGEDVAQITSGSFNFPTEIDGEEGFVEIVVKIPKYNDDEGYALREDYQIKLKNKAERELRKNKNKK